MVMTDALENPLCTLAADAGATATSTATATSSTSTKQRWQILSKQSRKGGSSLPAPSRPSHARDHPMNTSSSALSVGAINDGHTNSRQTRRRRNYNNNNNNNNNNPYKERRPVTSLAPKFDFKCFLSSRIRWMVISSLLVISIGAALGVFFYIRTDERREFQTSFDLISRDILSNFERAVERKLNSVNTLATSITSYAQDTNQTFPFVTVSNFAIRGSNVRVLADALVIHWLPFVTDENRLLWEEYALEHRFHINQDFQQDNEWRQRQDEEFDLHQEEIQQQAPSTSQQENSEPPPPPPPPDPETLTDGTGYHARIFEFGTGEPKLNGTGPFLPFWQPTPINGRLQANLNFDFASTPALRGALPIVMRDHRVVLNSVIIPNPGGQANLNANLVLGQYRHDLEEYKEDPLTFMVYPVFDSFGRNRTLGGVLATLLYWRLYFANTLPENTGGIICVIENSFNQTIAYRVDGKVATFVGDGDPHDPQYNQMAVIKNVNTFVQSRSGPATRGYTTVPLHETYGQYTIYIYPTNDLEDVYVTNNPIIYSIAVGCGFMCISVVFAWLLSRALTQHAKVETEQNMTSYFAHELRNPLGAIDSALQSIPDEDLTGPTKELVSGMQMCTSFMSNLMNNLLDARQLQEGKMELKPHPASLREIVSSVHRMLEPSVKPSVEFRIVYNTSRIHPQTGLEEDFDCVYCDVHRFRQVMTNVITNAIKYTASGSITLSIGWVDPVDLKENGHGGGVLGGGNTTARTDDGTKYRSIGSNRIVRFTCEDTGPGIPKSKQEQLFQRFVQRGGAPGSGLGLAISKLIVDQMGGTIRFESDPTVKPGTTCVVEVPMEVCDRPEMSTLFSPPNNTASWRRHEQSSTTANIASSIYSKINPIKNKPPGNVHNNDSDDREMGVSQQPIVEPLSILIVDDIKMNRMMLKRRLQKGVAVNSVICEAASGEEALEIIRGNAGSSSFQLQSGSRASWGTDAVEDQNSKTDGAVIVMNKSENNSKDHDVEQPPEPQGVPHFDVILMDQYMEEAGGVMLGTDAVIAMRRMQVDSFIIGCSGNDMSHEFIEAGANAFWGKPLPTNGEIISQIRAAVF